jgi:hypothetical protein
MRARVSGDVAKSMVCRPRREQPADMEEDERQRAVTRVASVES